MTAWADTSDPAAAPPAATPEAQPAKSDLETRARTAFEAGVVAFDAGDFGVAADNFGQAQKLMPHPDVLLNLAQSELKASRYAEAATHFYAYILAIAPRESGDARLGFAEARKYVTQVTISAPDGAAISLNGAAVSVAPLKEPLFVLPGTHQFKANEVAQTVVTEPGADLKLSLLPGEFESAAPNSSRHAVSLPAWFVETPVAWAGAGLTVAGLVFSSLSAVTAGRRYDAAENVKQQILTHYNTNSPGRGGSPCGPPAASQVYANACDVYTGKREGGDTWSTVSVISLVVGVASAAGTLVYYFVDPTVGSTTTEQTPTAQLGASITKDFKGVTLSGRF